MEKQITDTLFFLLDLYVDDNAIATSSNRRENSLESSVAEIIAFHLVRSIDDSGAAVRLLQKFPSLWSVPYLSRGGKLKIFFFS